MQAMIAIIIGIAALVYVLRIVINQLSQTEKNPKCDNCPVPDLQKSAKRNQ